MNRAGLRAAFAALLAAGVLVQLSAGPPTSGNLLPAARTVLVRAGFRVDPEHRATWAAGATRVEESLEIVARHPACAQPVRVRTRSFFERTDDADRRPGQLYIFGKQRRTSAPRLALLSEEIRMQARYLLSFGRGHRPTPSLLLVDDPSACLALTDPDWRSIW